MASSGSTNHLSRESSSAALYLVMSIFNDSDRRVCVDPVAAARTVEHSLLSTALYVETLVGEARLPLSVQRQNYSEWA